MSVAAGTRLGPYEVLTLIGARGPRTRVSTLVPNIREVIHRNPFTNMEISPHVVVLGVQDVPAVGRDRESHVGGAVDGRHQSDDPVREVEVIHAEVSSRIRAWNEIDPAGDNDERPIDHSRKHFPFLTTRHGHGPELRIAVVLCVVDVPAVG